MSATNPTLHHNLADRAKQITQRELRTYVEKTPGSQAANARAKKVLPLGVPSSLQAYDPHPIVIAKAQGAWMTDVDGNKLIDFSMGFGALFSGHINPVVRGAVDEQLDNGTLFVTPCELNADVAELLGERYGLPMWRFTNSGTEATMDAIRVARGATGREKIVKVEGGYHGHHDVVMVSQKPDLRFAGPADNPLSVPSSAGVTDAVVRDTIVIPFNDAEALERALSRNDVACFIVEPVLENLAIVLPDEGYLERVRELCDQYNVVLIFDEVKTGLTAGAHGASMRLGVKPDLITLAKSIGGGLPLAAFGGKKKYMDFVTNGKMAHFGTFNGNPLAMAGVRAIDRLCSDQALADAEALNQQALDRISEIIDEYQLPAHTVGFGVKGCVTWSTTPVRNYRDYKATDFGIAEAHWLFALNRGIITPPGLDEQWLISLAHGQTEIDLLVEDFREFAKALRS